MANGIGEEDVMDQPFTLKGYINLMLFHKYLQLFVMFTIGVVLVLINYNWCIETIAENYIDGGFFGAFMASLGLAIPFLGFLSVGKLGLYNHYRDWKRKNKLKGL